MKVKLGSVVASASGSVGGCVYSHNRYGPYIRQRVIPTNPSSPSQASIRTIFANLATAWNVDLDAGERTAWEEFAANVPKTDPLGNTVFTTGLNWYIAVNAPLVFSGSPRNDVAPALFNLTELTAPIPTITAPGTISIVFSNTDEWAGAADGWLHISYSRGVNSSRNFFKGPFRYAESIPGAAVPPSSPFSGGSPFVYAAGQKAFVRFIAQAADGRISLPLIRGTDVL
jgi:hypothetical protein